MSQSGSYLAGSGAAPVETLTGNSGGPVSPTGGNINVVGSGVVQVTGNPGTSTLTISVDGTVAETFTTDSGVATPSGNNIDIIGGTGITTSATGDTIVITASSSGIIQLEGDNGDTATGASVNVLGGNNITTAGDNVATITVSVSGTTNHAVQVGNASGSLTSLALGTAGQVLTSNGLGSNPSFKDASGISITGDSGGAVSPTAGNINLVGDGLVSVVGNPGTSTLTVTVSELLAQAFGTDDGDANPSSNKINIVGGPGVFTTGLDDTITITLVPAAEIINYTPIVNSDSPYTVIDTDNYIGANSTDGAITILFPNSTQTGRIFVVKDSNGTAVTHNITITTVGGVVTIDGATSRVINLAYGSVELLFDGVNYQVY